MSNPTLNIFSTSTAYSDSTPNSNPQLRVFDWTKKNTLISVSNPKAEKFTIIPSGSLQVFSGVRTTTLDATTAFTVTLSTLSTSTYRFTWVSGTNPTLRTNRNLSLTGIAVTVTLNNNATAVFSIPSGTFSGTVVGDSLFLPGPTTGDSATPFSTLNQGLWTVIAVASNNLSVTAIRPAGQTFSGANETQTLTSNGQIVAFSAAGVQINDKVDISAGFSSVDNGTYTISNVTPTFFEVSSGTSLPLESSITPGASGLIFYSVAKRFIRIETDNEASAQFNSDTSQNTRISPFIVGDPNNTGFLDKWGITWALTIINRSPTNTLNLLVLSAE
ncbi:MAG: hypothetical protein KGO96_07430 [Elusimicrobia bacterium]|nr:hypothetical protein [Elusimicrobiota bacterium]